MSLDSNSGKRKITQEDLKSVLHYNLTDGQFTWIKSGKKAGCRKGKGYVYIGLFKSQIFAHRLAWLYVYGFMPPEQIDHINRNTSDNRIENLRMCNASENIQNSAVRTDNSSGFRGVSWEKRKCKWQVYVWINKRGKFIGYFDDIQVAASAAIEARKKLHPFNMEAS